jgi:hypothetical protein
MGAHTRAPASAPRLKCTPRKCASQCPDAAAYPPAPHCSRAGDFYINSRSTTTPPRRCHSTPSSRSGESTSPDRPPHPTPLAAHIHVTPMPSIVGARSSSLSPDVGATSPRSATPHPSMPGNLDPRLVDHTSPRRQGRSLAQTGTRIDRASAALTRFEPLTAPQSGAPTHRSRPL